MFISCKFLKQIIGLNQNNVFFFPACNYKLFLGVPTVLEVVKKNAPLVVDTEI